MRRSWISCLLAIALIAGCTSAPSPSVTPSAAPSSPPSGSGPLPAGSFTPVPGAATGTGTGGASPSGPADRRVDAALAQLVTDEELVGQLFLLGWRGSNADDARETIESLRPAGMIFVANGSHAERATAINIGLDGHAEAAGVLPLLTAIDHEGGRIQRITDVPNLGSNLDFANAGATEAQACERGAEHARQLRAMGFDTGLSPVLDVNTNPENPVIGDRSYGTDPRLVARLGAAYIRGLQSTGIVGAAKHFPGHGDTTVDSHLGLPVLPFGRNRLNEVELVPFQRAIEMGTAAIVTGHLALPRIDPSGVPATLSEPVITGILREELGFDGLVISDDTAEMQAVTGGFTPSEIAVMSIAAGVDLLTVIGDLDRQREMRDAIVTALVSGQLPRSRVINAVRHVLAVKARFGLLGGQPDPEPAC